MILLRWVAIAGQLVAIVVAERLLGLQLEMALGYFVIGASIIWNLIATFIFPENKRLSEAQNLAMVLFDLLQLGCLLYLTGGLNNPFALLLLGPVTISATALSLRSTIVLNVTAIIVVTLLAAYHIPLRTAEGAILDMPELFLFGQWAALVIAILFTSAYSRRVTTEIHSMGDALAATQMTLAREQKLTDLGGVVAAAAHELGTPLATIKLTSAELFNDLSQKSEWHDLAEDAALIRDQADRCRDILRDMGRAGKDDMHVKQTPLEALILEAAEPHMTRGKEVVLDHADHAGDPQLQPSILRKPEIIHGLRNLIQNAVDFSRQQVLVESSWTESEISVRIIDDGPGFPSHVMGRIGDPFMRRGGAQRSDPDRPAYEGMGLGLFIAKTLLERTGARLRFANGSGQGPFAGAVVEVIWPRLLLEGRPHAAGTPLAPNPPIAT
jgi:two-component system sensor histidine kinase RegB